MDLGIRLVYKAFVVDTLDVPFLLSDHLVDVILVVKPRLASRGIFFCVDTLVDVRDDLEDVVDDLNLLARWLTLPLLQPLVDLYQNAEFVVLYLVRLHTLLLKTSV